MTEGEQARNVLLLTVDALRADHLSCHGYERKTTPFLDGLAEESRWFLNCYSASSHTREAVPALLTGQYPDIFAANGYRLVEKSIAEYLSEAGYATGAFHSNPYISRAYEFDRGFDEFDDDLMLGRNKWIALAQRALNKFVFRKGRYHVRAEELNRRALAWLDSVTEPAFLWAHYMDPHGPYNPPGGSQWASRDVSDDEAQALYQKAVKQPDKVTEKERKLMIDLYDGEIRYLDGQLRTMFEGLRERELLEDSLVVVTADHGDAFGEHGYYGHPREVDEELLHVPMFVYGADIEAGIVDGVASTLGVIPSILEWANIDSKSLPGESLLGSRSNDIVFSSTQDEIDKSDVRKFAARSESVRIHLERDGDGQVSELTAFDPTDGTKLDSDSDLVRVVETKLRTHSSQTIIEADEQNEGKPAESNEVIERLEGLGYR